MSATAEQIAVEESDLRSRVDRARITLTGIEHNQLRGGVTGALLTVNIETEHHAGDALWLKAQLRCAGWQLLTTRGWQGWCDAPFAGWNTDALPCMAFTAMLPLTPMVEHEAFSDLQLFIPYQAVQWPKPEQAKGADVEVELFLSDAKARRLAATTVSFDIASAQVPSIERSVPSPQALGLWPRTPGSGAELTRCQMRSSESGLRVELETKLYRSTELTVGDALRVELRLLTPRGNLIGSRLSSLSDANEKFLLVKELLLTSAQQESVSVVLEVPADALDLEPGRHDVFAELSLVNRLGRSLCGVAERVAWMQPEPIGTGVEIGARVPEVSEEGFIAVNLQGQVEESSAGLAIKYSLELDKRVAHDHLLLIGISAPNGDVLVDQRVRDQKHASPYDQQHERAPFGMLVFERLLKVSKGTSAKINGTLSLTNELLRASSASGRLRIRLELLDPCGDDIASKELEFNPQPSQHGFGKLLRIFRRG